MDATPEPDPHNPATDPPQRSLFGFGFTLVALSLAGCALSLFIGGILVMGSDPCSSAGNEPYICTVEGQQTVFWLPWVGLIFAVVAALIVAAVAHRKHRSPWPGIPIGAVIYATPVIIAYSIASATT